MLLGLALLVLAATVAAPAAKTPLPAAPPPAAPLPEAPLPEVPLPEAPLPEVPLPDTPLPDTPVQAPRGGSRDHPALPGDPDSPFLDRHYRTHEQSAPWPQALDPGQEVLARRFQIVAAMGIRPGMRVADFGVGQGLVTALLARAVGPEGVVYGVGSAPDLPAVLKTLAREYHVANLVPVASIGEDTPLPAAGIDLAVVAGGLGQFTETRAVLATIYRALIPYGTLVIVAPRPAAGTPTGSGRPDPADRDTLLALARESGFRLVDEAGFLEDNAFLRLERGGDDTAAPPAAPARPGEAAAGGPAPAAPPPAPTTPGRPGSVAQPPPEPSPEPSRPRGARR